ncbi:MAG TPA: thioesterase family protein [Planctomycetota bacterium]|nr:thioesterase family protein [Planctomycetota bacterium]
MAEVHGAGHGTGGQPRTFVTTARVRYGDTDQGSVAYHANYLLWFEEGRNEMLRELGRPYALVEREDAVLLTVVEANLRYHRPARYDDVLRIETRLVSLRRVRLQLETSIFSEDRQSLLTTGAITLACVDPSGVPVALPQSLRECLARAFEPAGEV